MEEKHQAHGLAVTSCANLETAKMLGLADEVFSRMRPPPSQGNDRTACRRSYGQACTSGERGSRRGDFIGRREIGNAHTEIFSTWYVSLRRNTRF
jgi:hypothetical protein